MPYDKEDADAQEVYDDEGGYSHRDFSPEHYLPAFRRFGVRLVVRLNAPQVRRAR